MNASSFGANLTQLTRLRGFNCFFVREDDGLTLVDTDLAGSAKAILEAAAALGAPIVRIVLTHAHGDHVGSLDELHKLVPNAEVSISARDARFLAGDMRLDPDEPQAKLRGSYQKVETKPNRLLQPGDRVGSLEAIAAPGHTPGHMAFFDVRDRTLIAGDAFYTIGGVTVANVLRWRFPFPAIATWHGPTAIESARRLRGLNPTQLAVGHGGTVRNPVAAMDAAIREAEQKVKSAPATK